VSNKRGPYSSPRQQQRRMRILAAASEQLERHGLSALTMQCIAEVGDVSTKTLYNLFGSRDQLLLEAASQHLSDLEHSPAVVEVEEGIPRLLAFMFGAIRQFEDMPLLSRAVIAILLRREAEPEEAYARLGRGQRFAHTALEVALDRGELLPAIDLEQLSYLIAANQWGAVLLWEKGLLGLKQRPARAPGWQGWASERIRRRANMTHRP
jgi:AcrR family transcriptional regulator